MTLTQALQSIKAALYALFVYRKPEPFNYIRDTNELTSGTHFKISSHQCPYWNDDCPICIKK